MNRILNCVDKLTGKNWRRIYPGPIHTWDSTQWVSYVLTDAGDHYQVKHPVISTRFYANHTEFLDENFTKASISDERWAVEYLSGDEWLDAGFWGAELSYEVMNKNEVRIPNIVSCLISSGLSDAKLLALKLAWSRFIYIIPHIKYGK